MDHCRAHFGLFGEPSVVHLHSEICAPRFESLMDSVRVVACDMSLKSEASMQECERLHRKKNFTLLKKSRPRPAAVVGNTVMQLLIPILTE